MFAAMVHRALATLSQRADQRRAAHELLTCCEAASVVDVSEAAFSRAPLLVLVAPARSAIGRRSP